MVFLMRKTSLNMNSVRAGIESTQLRALQEPVLRFVASCLRSHITAPFALKTLATRPDFSAHLRLAHQNRATNGLAPIIRNEFVGNPIQGRRQFLLFPRQSSVSDLTAAHQKPV